MCTLFLTIILPSVDSRREGGDFTFIYFTSAYDHIKNMLRIFKAGFSGNFKNTEPRAKFPYSYKKKRVILYDHVILRHVTSRAVK